MEPLDPAGSASELFTDRARRADAAFVLDDDREAVRALCERLDGLPLAIELAAAKVRVMSPSELVERIAHRLDLLQADAFVPQRHRSLRAAIDWSYQALRPDEQALLGRLSVFAGAVSLAVVEAVADDEVVEGGRLLTALSELVDHSMIVTRHAGTETRYRLLDSIRAFAHDELVRSGRGVQFHEKHARFVAARLASLIERTRGPAEPEAVAQIDALWPELRAAVTWALEQHRADLCCELLAGLGVEALFRERSELRTWADEALALPDIEREPRAHELLATAACADWTAAAFDSGSERAARARHLVENDARPLTIDVGAAEFLHVGVRDPATFVEVTRRIALDFAKHGDRFGELWATNGQGMAYGYVGRFDEALIALDRAAELAQRVGSPLMRALCEFTHAIALLDSDPVRALEAAESAMCDAEQVRATWILAATPNYLAPALVRAGDPERALRYVAATIDGLADGGSVQSTTNTVRNLVALLDVMGVPERAARLVGWLGANPNGIAGTPGMRQAVEDLRARLPQVVGEVAFARLDMAGASMTLAEAIREAQEAIAPLR